MALKGTLRDFSVADIFQLIGQQQKSGSLYVRTKEKEAHVVFDTGKLVLGTFRKSDSEFLLGTMLLRSGVITSDQLTEAVQNQKATLRSLGDILIGMNAIAPQTLGEFVQLQLKEVLFRLFQWKDGLYEFVAEQIKYNKSILKPQPAEALLMDCFRMLDEWPAISRKIVSTESVFRSLVDPTELAEGAASDLSEEEKRVLRLFDGHRSLQEVVYLSRLGTFDACRVTAGLSDKGLVLRLDHLSLTRVEARRDTGQPEGLAAWLGWSYRFLLAVFALSILLPVAAFGLRSHWASRFGQFNAAMARVYAERSSFEALRRGSDRRILETLLELHRLETGAYPRTLDDLPPADRKGEWEYARNGEGYTLIDRAEP